MVFFVLLLAFSRVGVALGMGNAPVGIGNFFLGSPSITESNLNQVLGLLVGPAGSPGVAGVSGANGRDGLNGLPGMPGINGVNGVDGVDGTPGAPGAPGAQGAQGVAGPAGPSGTSGSGGTGGFLGVGGGNLALGTCDDKVVISVAQTFKGSQFNLETITIAGILGINAENKGCAGQNITIHLTVSDKSRDSKISKACTLKIPDNIRDADNRISFNTNSCNGIFSGIDMKNLDQDIGLEFTEDGVVS